MECEICKDKGISRIASHGYIYVELEHFHYYCGSHFKEFCKMVVEE